MTGLPTGTVTFLFTDIEGSTELLQHLGDHRYSEVLAEHQTLLRAVFEERNGREVDTQGDAFLVAFPRARDAVAAAVMAQQALMKHPWADGASLRVRMGLHTGEPVSAHGRYVGLDVHRVARICAAGHGGQILLSQSTRELVATDPPLGISLRDLGEHRLKDLAAPQRLFQVVTMDLPADFPALQSLDLLPNNLPRQLTSFVGREQEIAQVKRGLSTAYLVTLTGTGGAGKTRLALQVAADLLDQFPDGVWLAQLAPLSEPTLVPKAVASALGIPEQPGRPLTETVVAYLRPRAPLLLLDNCEHLLQACANLAHALLQTCPNLRILATSREQLGTTGELTYRVPSLSLPDLTHPPPLEALTQYEAVRLFFDRASAIAPEFIVTSKNARAVTQICRRLEGIPLAIELTAARVKVLTMEQIAARLEDGFRLLTGGGRMALPHHQTLRATMDWSYALLSEQERTAFRRLSVFAGGWSVDAAEAVCAGGGIDATSILDLLTSLVDKSLAIVEERHGLAWYRLLATVREYASERLVEANEAHMVRRNHSNWYITLAEEVEPKLRGPDQVRWLDRLEDEHDNLRGALDFCKGEGDGADRAARLASALRWFWSFRGHFREGRAQLEAIMERGPSPILQVKVLVALTPLVNYQDHVRAIALAETGLVLCRENGDVKNSAYLTLELAEAAGRQGQYERALELGNQCVNIGRALDDGLLLGAAFRMLGLVSLQRGCPEDAVPFYEESLALAETRGEPRSIGMALGNLGFSALDQGDSHRAAAYFTDAMRWTRELADPFLFAQLFWAFGYIASIQERYQRAARLLAVAEASREKIGYQRTPLRRVQYARSVAATRAAFGEAAFAAAWAEGQAMTLEQAIEYALAVEAN
jgi:predicted ATPase/class 3 adenylate cyclase